MDQYDLITDEPRLQQAIYAMHILSDVCFSQMPIIFK